VQGRSYGTAVVLFRMHADTEKGGHSLLCPLPSVITWIHNELEWDHSIYLKKGKHSE